MNCVFLILLVLSLVLPTRAQNKSEGKLFDQVKALYFDGEFEQVKSRLENYLSENPNPPKENKIFAYKYLSVVYAANPNTRHKAEALMYKLVALAPKIELLDLYVSESIDNMFRKVKDRYQREKQYQANYDELGRPTEESKPLENKAENKNGRPEGEKKSWLPWALGGTVVVSSALVTYFVVNSSHESTPAISKTMDLPPP